MDRVFDETDSSPASRDRLLFKLNNDRTMKIFSAKTRPLIEIMKKKLVADKKRKLFETGK